MSDVDTWDKPIPFSWILFPHPPEPTIGIVYPDGYCMVFGDVNHYRPDEFKVLGLVVPFSV